MKELKRFQLSTKVVVVLKGRLQARNFGCKYMREREREERMRRLPDSNLRDREIERESDIQHRGKVVIKKLLKNNW